MCVWSLLYVLKSMTDKVVVVVAVVGSGSVHIFPSYNGKWSPTGILSLSLSPSPYQALRDGFCVLARLLCWLTGLPWQLHLVLPSYYTCMLEARCSKHRCSKLLGSNMPWQQCVLAAKHNTHCSNVPLGS